MLSCLAPMDGISDLAYRIICKEIFDTHKHPTDQLLLRTEFMSADGFMHNPVGVIKHMHHSTYSSPLIAQIFGGNKESLVHCAVGLDKEYDFAGIELNMGCPSPKIYTCEAGSGMLKDKEKTLDIVATIAQSITTPFSIKTRIGLNQADQEEQMKFLLAAAEYTPMISIHGRTFGQSHAGTVHRDFIYQLKQALPHHTIIGNGWLRSYQDAVDLQWNLDGMMRWQSAIGNPWILTPQVPTLEQRRDTIIRHLTMMLLCERDFLHQSQQRSGILATYDYDILCQNIKDIDHIITQEDEQRRSPVEFRKHLFCYINGLPGNKLLKQKIPGLKKYHELVMAIREYFDEIQ
jgi:tRNA-dihydrouridine synthase